MAALRPPNDVRISCRRPARPAPSYVPPARRLREVVELLLADGEPKPETEFVGTQTVVLS